MRESQIWPNPWAHITRNTPDEAQIYFCPEVLQATAGRFQRGFDGLVTYAVKANPGEEVLTNLVAAGIHAFDVASPVEMRAVRAVCKDAVLHYNNPVRSPEEVATAMELNVASYSVDCVEELDKLCAIPHGTEISVRLALPIAGAAYDFGEKFGLSPERAAHLLKTVAERGYTPSMTFHPGTQCADPESWGAYIKVVAQVAREAGVTLSRLNVGGGFASHRTGDAPDLEAIFDHIRDEVGAHLGTDAPDLVCEPGRAMVADAFTLLTRVKALRTNGAVFLNDGTYGGLTEMRDIGVTSRIEVIAPNGTPRSAGPVARVVFGPTCDSLDRLPDPLPLPGDLQAGDYIFFKGMGAYTRSLTTQFNGYGIGDPITVSAL